MNDKSIIRLTNVAKSMLGVAVLSISVAGLVGCGGPSKSTVKGKITYEGKPVDGGQISFSPTGGEEAAPTTTDVNSDGTYELEAVVGKNSIEYLAPQPEITPEVTEANPAKPSPFDGLVPKSKEAEVKSGEQEINIELVKPQ